jgi:hypothetical protein
MPQSSQTFTGIVLSLFVGLTIGFGWIAFQPDPVPRPIALPPVATTTPPIQEHETIIVKTIVREHTTLTPVYYPQPYPIYIFPPEPPEPPYLVPPPGPHHVW